MCRSVVSFVRNNEVPHIATYETHQRSEEISFITQKRLLQQYLPKADTPWLSASLRLCYSFMQNPFDMTF
jgi:hypothetical protein